MGPFDSGSRRLALIARNNPARRRAVLERGAELLQKETLGEKELGELKENDRQAAG